MRWIKGWRPDCLQRPLNGLECVISLCKWIRPLWIHCAHNAMDLWDLSFLTFKHTTNKMLSPFYTDERVECNIVKWMSEHKALFKELKIIIVQFQLQRKSVLREMNFKAELLSSSKKSHNNDVLPYCFCGCVPLIMFASFYVSLVRFLLLCNE